MRKRTSKKMIKPYFEKSGFVLFQGNCLDVLKEIPENSVDMIS